MSKEMQNIFLKVHRTCYKKNDNGLRTLLNDEANEANEANAHT
jgi:hypothetical protein